MTLQSQQLYLGTRVTGGFEVLGPEERRRHLYIIGQTGTGKSTLLLNLIAQDIATGEGLALLDPHGDLAEAVLMHVRRKRTNDFVYINPADAARPIGFNPLSGVREDLKPIVAEDVVGAFKHVWPDSWGPRLDYILMNAIRALLDVPGGTLLMLPRLLIDDSFREHLVLRHVRDPVVQSFWRYEYAAYSPSLRAEAISPIQNKIGRVLIEPRLRNMLAQPRNTITLRRLMDEGAIVICNLAKGRLGESVSHLLGALLTTSIAQAALSRADAPASERRTFHLYADEFQSFATTSFALILSEARKYGLTLRQRAVRPRSRNSKIDAATAWARSLHPNRSSGASAISRTRRYWYPLSILRTAENSFARCCLRRSRRARLVHAWRHAFSISRRAATQRDVPGFSGELGTGTHRTCPRRLG